MAVTNTPNMNLPVPVVGNEPGPNYASDVNNSLIILDQHNHTAGSGVLITPAAIDINTALPFNNNFATALAGSTYTAQIATPANTTVYVSGVDLFYIDSNGNNIRITQSGGIAGTSGSISNLTSPASASYVAANKTFVWQSDVNTSANMDAASYLLRNLVANSNAVTLSPPNALASNYTITLPLLPVSQKIMALDSSGNMSAPYSVDNSTIVISSNIIQVPAGGITTTQIASGTIVGSNVASNINLPGDTVQEDGKNLVVSSTNATTSLAIVRGSVDASGNVAGGEGFTSVRNSTGIFTVTFTNAFSDIPAVTTVCTPFAANSIITKLGGNGVVAPSEFSVTIQNSTGTLINAAGFNFIAIGQR